MKTRRKPISMLRNIKSASQIFRECELKGVCFSAVPKWKSKENLSIGGFYRFLDLLKSSNYYLDTDNRQEN